LTAARSKHFLQKQIARVNDIQAHVSALTLVPHQCCCLCPPCRHIEAHNEGWTSTTRAMETTLRSEQAQPLFDKAIERFKEVRGGS
jgi:hypothetical protein